jgi:MFS family permease
MSDAVANAPSSKDRLLFWGCFIALVTTAFGFITRVFLVNTWAAEFNLDPAEAGRLTGVGIWPFAASIIGFSLLIDKIGYKVAMVLAFIGHIAWAVMGVSAYYVSQSGDKETAYQLVYWGSLVLALGNGTVEAFINPVVATMFSREKTKWLNILHAGWPGGLVIAGIIVIFMADASWGLKVGIIAAPAVIYFLILITRRFPVQERVAAGVSYREMLGEFGILGAIVVGVLVTLQLMDFFKGVPAFSVTVDDEVMLADWAKWLFIGIGAALVVAFGIYTRRLGRPLMFVLVLIMMPLATTEIGTDGWITGIMEGVFEMSPEEVESAGGADSVTMIGGKAYKMHPGWVLVYTSAIMMVLRFFAGPIVHSLSPLGLLAASAVLAIVGLYTLSFTTGLIIFGAATLYAFGKTFFWPTMLGVVAEQTPKGGALTLNAISGIGMLAVGTLGFPYIGALQAEKQIEALAKADEITQQVPGLVEDGKLTVLESKDIYEIIEYQAISEDKLKETLAPLPTQQRAELSEQITDLRGDSRQGALANMTVFPAIMLVGYLALIVYFKSKGGYEAEVLTGHAANDAEYTGGVEGPADQ